LESPGFTYTKTGKIRPDLYVSIALNFGVYYTFRIEGLFAFTTQFIYVLCTTFLTNIDYFPLHY